MNEILKKILELKNAQGLSDRAFENKLSLPERTVNDWRRKSQGYLKILSQIALFFNVSTDYLLGLTDNPEKKDISQTVNAKPKYQILYENLSHTAQELICKHMANILESEGVNVKELLANHL